MKKGKNPLESCRFQFYIYAKVFKDIDIRERQYTTKGKI